MLANKLLSIQYLRAVAALLIVFVHCSPALVWTGMSHRFADCASVGVDLFFVISGFIIAYISGRRYTRPTTFIIERLERIVPLYWLLTLAAFAVALIAPRLMGGTRADLMDLLKSMFFVPYRRDDGEIFPILYVGWSLNYEMFFYSVFAACLALRSHGSRLIAVAAIILALVVLGFAFRSEYVPVRYLTKPIMLEFLFGVMLAEIYDFLPRSRRSGHVGLSLASIGLVALLIVPLLPQTVMPIKGILASIVMASMLTAERGGVLPEVGILSLLGDASYSLYLTHSFVSQGFIKAAAFFELHAPAETLLLVAIIMFVSCWVSILCYRKIERPSLAWARLLTRGRMSTIARKGSMA